MDIMDRIKVSDWVSGIGGFLLLISVFLQWFKVSYQGISIGGAGASGWDATKLSILILLAAVIVIAVVVLRILDIDLSMIPVPMGVVVMVAGAVSFLIVILRVFIHQDFLGVSYGIFIALAATVDLIVGGVIMQREGMY